MKTEQQPGTLPPERSAGRHRESPVDRKTDLTATRSLSVAIIGSGRHPLPGPQRRLAGRRSPPIRWRHGLLSRIKIDSDPVKHICAATGLLYYPR
jgi:hypothetical protein